MIGPNVRRLIAWKMSVDAVAPGGGFAEALEYIQRPGLASRGQEAADWVKAAITALKAAPGNPFGDDDEAIAGDLVRRLEEKLRRK